jgi:hypothetical protein
MSRDVTIYQRHLAGRTFAEIAAELGVSRRTVAKAVERASAQAREELGQQTDRLRVEQTFLLKQIFREALDAWDRSKRAEEITKVSTEGGGAAGKKKAEKTTRPQVGDPRFLQIAESTLAALRKLWSVEGKAQDDTPAEMERALVLEDEDWYGNRGG